MPGGVGTFRCAGCRQRFPKPASRRIGLSFACSSACAQTVMRRQPRRRVGRARPAPSDVPVGTRDQVLVRDRLRCRYCGTPRGIHLHHIHYRSEGVDHSERNLIALCPAHHELVHSDKARWQPVCEAYIAILYNQGRQTYLLDLERELGG